MKKILLLTVIIGQALLYQNCAVFKKSVSTSGETEKQVLTARDVDVPETAQKERNWDTLTNDEKKKRNKAVEKANSGNKNFKAGKYKAAIDDFQAALKEWPDLSDAYLGLGNAYYKDSQYKNSIENLDNYIRFNPRTADAYYTKGLACKKLEDRDNALKNFLLVTKINSRDPAPFLEIANIYYGDSAFDDAFKNYEKARDLDKSLWEAYLGLGQIYIQLKDYQKAMEVLDEGLKINKDKRLSDTRDMASGLLLLRQGRELFQDKKYKEALLSFRESERLIPDNYELNFLTGQSFYFLNDAVSAEQYLLKAYKIKSDDVNLYLTLVDIFLKAKRYKDAINYLKEAKEKWPENYRIFNLMGMVYNETESFTKAIESFQAGISLKNDYAEAYLNLGVAYYEVERYKEARESFNKAYQLNKDLEKATEFSKKSSAMLLVQEGNKLFEEKNYKAAIEKYNQALKMQPDFLEILVNLGNSYLETAVYPSAVLNYKKALEKEKNYFPALLGLERAYRNSGDVQNARKVSEQLEKLKGQDPQLYYKLGLSLEANKKFNEAIEEYKKALQLNPGFKPAKNRLANAHYKKGVVLFNAKQYSESRDEFQNALRYNPSFFDAQDKIDYLESLKYINTAGDQYERGEYDKAIESYKMALKTYRDMKELYLNLANIYIIKKDFRNAEKILNEGIRNFPQSPDYYQMLGLIYMNQGDYKTSYNYYSKSLELDPKNDSVLNDIGEIFMKSESFDEALKIFTDAITVNPGNLNAHINLGIAHFKKGDYQKAVREFEATKELDRNYDPAYFNCGLGYFKLNDYVKSEYNFKQALRLKEDVPAFYFYLARTLYLMPGKIDEAVKCIEVALSVQEVPLYYYGAGKIYEQKMQVAMKMDVPKYLEKAIQSYKRVIIMIPGTQMAQWAQERLIALVPDVRLMNIYSLYSASAGNADYDNGILYAGDNGGILYAIDTLSRSKELIRNKQVFGVPVTSDVRSFNKRVYAGLEDGRMICMNADLNKLWTFDAESRITGFPAMDKGNIYFGTENGNVYSLNMITGQLAWKFNSGSMLSGDIVLDKDRLYFCNRDGEVICLDRNGRKVWVFEAVGGIRGSPALCQNYIGAGTDKGIFYILNKNTGEVSRQIRVEMPVEGGVCSDKYNFYFGAGSILYSVYPEGKINWKFYVNSSIKSVPDIRETLVVFSEEKGTVYAVDLETGKQKWKYVWSTPVYTRPLIISQNSTYISTSDGSILELYYK
ncbi:MAG: tetratricopeptide repeat protein [bacterium]|nr:tetratricopeptide repeat protein [bacterium]